MNRPATPPGSLTPAQLDRAAGVLLAQACGDALGVPYEFQPRLPPGETAEMAGGGLGPYAPGEYSDDTQMAACIAQVTATGADPAAERAQDEIVERFLDWKAAGATDIGAQTSRVLSDVVAAGGRAGPGARDAAARLHARTGRTAGNGALMRTAPVALAYLGDPEALARAARSVAELTHADPLAGDACVLWCAGIATAVSAGTFEGVRAGLDLLPLGRRGDWADWLAEAERAQPWAFNPNGFTVPALQAAYAAVVRTPVPGTGSFPCLHLQHALQAAVHSGDDTDTVAAIAGALLGARWGASAVPFGWRRVVHGWPQFRARDLVRLALLSARGGQPDGQGWPSAPRVDYGVAPGKPVPHPADERVLLGTAATRGERGAVVSLCRLGTDEVPAAGVEAGDHLESWLVDSEDPDDNPNLDFAVDDAARAVAALRDEGHTVLLHCARMQSRTPTVAARYATLRGWSAGRARAAVLAALPDASPLPTLWRTLDRPG